MIRFKRETDGIGNVFVFQKDKLFSKWALLQIFNVTDYEGKRDYYNNIPPEDEARIDANLFLHQLKNKTGGIETEGIFNDYLKPQLRRFFMWVGMQGPMGSVGAVGMPGPCGAEGLRGPAYDDLKCPKCETYRSRIRTEVKPVLNTDTGFLTYVCQHCDTSSRWLAYRGLFLYEHAYTIRSNRIEPNTNETGNR